TVRKPENISPEEISIGIVATISKSFGATHDELVISISRLLGFKSTSLLLRSNINDAIQTLINSNKIKLENGLLILQID
ncbi:hypothetical protein J1785_01895, partial [Rahnella sp. SL6]|uniref:hypothetical protein n=1 Tax=Rahnella perminowiae TaxID=2816244 RepID=UPI003B75BFAE|nr:hypothetical protein [Rahnella perminowiae]